MVFIVLESQCYLNLVLKVDQEYIDKLCQIYSWQFLECNHCPQ